ncbi:hypothetical protein HU200_034414 [Digitaria exilis]|uniref:Uncharacterized protein n=1 Tax=Digitaria exilis TaxID=1010633 RepID=A0A835BU39_9POAL|nr:hypothetical protein HU200_034414 [Digitaria exilis]
MAAVAVSARLLFLLALVSVLAPPAAAEPWQMCGNSGNYTTNSTYQGNLARLATAISLNASASPALFAKGSVGSVPEIAYALALLRDATIYYDACYLRFSNQNFLPDTGSNDNELIVWNGQNVSSPVRAFDAAVGVLLNATGDNVTANPTRLFATGEEAFDASNPTIYGLTQCTPDMSPAECRSCLGGIIGLLPGYLSGRKGRRVLGVRCNFRYEIYSFFSGAPTLRLSAQSSPPPALPPAPVNATPTAPPPPPDSTNNSGDIGSIDSLLLDISTLRAATDNFAENNRLGEGGFGAVYKGVLPDGQEIAVKRLSQTSGQRIQELKTELVLVAKLQHKNLVRLVGVCLQEHEKLLVYEYMPNRSIDTILFDPEKRKELDWGKRLKIINGIARGLQYLHEDSQLKIIHRDLKASNWVYGTRIEEYAMRGHYSIKSDVFSFGILILEILIGRRSSGSFNIEQSVDLLIANDLPVLTQVWEHWTTGTIVDIMDPSLRGKAPAEQMLRCVHIGLLCLQDNPVDRPMMSTINIMLSSGTVSLQAPLKPVFFIPKSGYYSTVYSESYPTAFQSTGNVKSGAISPNEVSITEMEPR